MNFGVKVKLLTTGLILLFLLVWLKLLFLQIVSGDSLSGQAEAQHFSILSLPAKRGEILFSDHTPLVSDATAYLLYANLTKFTGDKKVTTDALAGILAAEIPYVATPGAQISAKDRDHFYEGMRKSLAQNLLDRLNLPSVVWVNLAHFLPPKIKDQVAKLGIAGLDFIDEEVRHYPEASMAAQVVGFVGSDNVGNPKGYFGLEGFYDRELSGRPGELRLEKDAFGQPIAIGSETRQDKEDGQALITTLDRGVQFFVEKNLESGIKQWQAKGGTAVVMDPENGAILALANFPRYDPANFSYYLPSLYKNPAVADLYEPGSIMKPMIMAAAINENKLTPTTTCDNCAGPVRIGDDYIHTFNNSYHPNTTMTEVLINSDNTGMVFVGSKLGFPLLYSYLNKWGFNQKTGVDLEEEVTSHFRPENSYYPIDRATLTFGQGILVTSLQMVRAFAALANGGSLVTPHLVSAVEDHGQTISLSWKTGPRVISVVTAKTVTEMLVQVANNSPEHFPKDRIPELAAFRIAAKSGTAQIAVGGKYRASGTTASLVGYFPADKPRFVVLVKLDEPEIRPWGSDTAGPIFFQITRDLLAYYGITP